MGAIKVIKKYFSFLLELTSIFDPLEQHLNQKWSINFPVSLSFFCWTTQLDNDCSTAPGASRSPPTLRELRLFPEHLFLFPGVSLSHTLFLSFKNLSSLSFSYSCVTKEKEIRHKERFWDLRKTKKERKRKISKFALKFRIDHFWRCKINNGRLNGRNP